MKVFGTWRRCKALWNPAPFEGSFDGVRRTVNEIEAELKTIGGRLQEIDRSLNELAERVRNLTGGLPGDAVDDLLDRMDEMMDLLYLVDEHLCTIIKAAEHERES